MIETLLVGLLLYLGLCAALALSCATEGGGRRALRRVPAAAAALLALALVVVRLLR
jgi:hypothetical protein